ncbi:MAG: EamA family transporter [Gemmatimonadota bacterium]|nr:MAG: EamA family transporter [Gemmatimonadota bacterium]
MTRPVLVWLLLSAIWGSTWLFIKIGLEDLPPFTFAGVRFVVAMGSLVPFLLIRKVRLPKSRTDLLLMLGTGLLTFTAAYGFVYWGEQYISSGLAALLFGTFPLFGLIIAHFYLPTERMTWTKLAGVVLGILGIGLVFSNELRVTGLSALWGSVAIVLAALSAAYADVLIKLRGGHIDPALLTMIQMAAGTIPLLAVGLITEGNPLNLTWTPLAVFSLLYLAVIGTSLGFVLLYWLIKHMEVTKTMLITLVTPLIAVMLGIVFLDEQLSWRTAIGGAAIVAGIGLVVWQGAAVLEQRVAFLFAKGKRAGATHSDTGP